MGEDVVFTGVIGVDEVTELLSRMVATPSVNDFGNERLHGPLYGEAQMGELVAAFGRKYGLKVDVFEVLPNRYNVLLHLPGKLGQRHLLLETHMDTVQPGQMPHPFTPRVIDGRLYGLGSCDAKGCLTAMMLALKHVAQKGPAAAHITLAAVVDEEFAYRGVSHLLKQGFKADAGVVGEPTELRIVRAHKGCVRWHVEVRGQAAHSSRMKEGRNAVMHMRHVLALIEEELQPQLDLRSHPLVGEPTLNVGVIQGGLQPNIVPDRCLIEIDRRLIPGETPETALAEFEAGLERLRARIPELQVFSHAPSVVDIPMEVPEDAAIVTRMQEVQRATGGDYQAIGVPFGTDASKLTAAGIPTIVFGPGSIVNAHTIDESVDLEQVRQAAEAYAELMWRF